MAGFDGSARCVQEVAFWPSRHRTTFDVVIIRARFDFRDWRLGLQVQAIFFDKLFEDECDELVWP